MIRTILVVLFVLIIFILSLIAWPIEYIIGKFSPKARDISSLRFIQWVFKVILFLSGVKVTVKGCENLLKDEAAVYIGNHRGFFDTIVSYSLMPGVTGFVAKKEMEKVPFINVWMKLLHCLFLDRSNPREGLKAILKGVEELENGVSIVIFPEGTRNKSDGLLPFHGGSFKLADRSNCRIVPMAVTHADDVLENHFPFLKATHMTIEFCTPIDTASLDKAQRKDLPNMTRDIILDAYNRNNVF